MRLQIEARNGDMQSAGIIPRRTCNLVARFNDVGTWTLTVLRVNLTDDVYQAFTEGGGVLIRDMDAPPDDNVVMSGPWNGNEESWTATDTGVVTLSGVSDETYMGERFLLPNPGQPITTAGQAGTGYDKRTGPAANVIAAYVRANVSATGALPGRGQPYVTVAPDTGYGTVVTGLGRYGETVLSEAQALAVAGGDIGFRLRQQDQDIVFTTYMPAYRDDVLLSRQSGTLSGGKTTRSAPTVTHAIILQQGDGGDRFVQEYATNESQDQSQKWHRRIEKVIDRRDTDDIATAQQSAIEALAAGTATGTIVAEVQDTATVRYGREYRLGDRVPYTPWWLPVTAAPLVDVVREVQITSAESGPVTVKAAVGPPGTSTAPTNQYARIRALEAQVRSLRSS